VSCGVDFTIWIANGKAMGAGSPQYGQLGDGTDHAYNAKDSSICMVFDPQVRRGSMPLRGVLQRALRTQRGGGDGCRSSRGLHDGLRSRSLHNHYLASFAFSRSRPRNLVSHVGLTFI
jgi:hypothetical protein